MTFIQDSIDDGSLVLYHNYRSGHCNDLSGNGNDGANTGHWASDGLQFGTADEVTVADAAELQLTEGALVVLGRFFSQGAESLIYKRDAGGTNYDFNLTAANVQLYDGTNTRFLATSIVGAKCVALNMANGEAGAVYVDGISRGSLDNTSAISVDNADLLIGNSHGGGTQFSGSLSAVLIFNRKLTAAEHAQLYAELSTLKWPRKTAAKHPGSYGNELVTDVGMETAGVGAWYAGNSATLTKETNNVLGGMLVLRVAHNGTTDPFADEAGILTPGTRYRATGWARGDGTGYPEVSLGDDVVWTGTTATGWQRFDVTHTPSVGTYVILKTKIAVAGYCEFDNVSIREVYDTEMQFKTDWNAQIDTNFGGANYLSNTKLYVNSGNMSVTDEEIDGDTCKVATCAAAGGFQVMGVEMSGDPTQDAYGTWEFWFNKAAATTLKVGIVSDDAAITTGYYFEVSATEELALVESGVGDKFRTAAGYVSDSTWYKVRITRRQSDGLFSVYLDDVLVDTATDNTTKTSTMFVFDVGTGDKIALGDLSGEHCICKLHGAIAP